MTAAQLADELRQIATNLKEMREEGDWNETVQGFIMAIERKAREAIVELEIRY